MTSDISVKASGGLPFDEAGITGITISYGFNMIPSAMLSLNVAHIMEKSPAFFQDPTSYKKSTKTGDEVVIDIKSSTGCLTFTGYFDGLSVVQTPGGMEYTAIIKNKFQVLTELYPKLMGMYPGSLIIGRMTPNLTYIPDTLEYKSLKAGGATLPANLSPTEWYIKYLQLVVESQLNTDSYWSSTQDLSALRAILDSTDYKENLNLCKELLGKINVDFAKTAKWQVNQDLTYHANLIAEAGDDCWSVLLTVMNECGCLLLVSDKKLYVIPQSNFMVLKRGCPPQGKQATEPNTAFPADYNNFVLNDNSFKNIKYCVVTAISSTALNVNRGLAPNLQQLGVYPRDPSDSPDDGSSGILMVPTPAWMGRTIAGAVWLNTKTLSRNQDKPYTEAGKTKKLETSEEAKGVIDTPADQFKDQFAQSEEIKKLLDDYAKARFLTEKYTDRTGSFNSQFNPRWVPGTTGFLASRQPSMMFNFFVTGVTHSITLNGGKSGSAYTQVTFNSARYGGTPAQIPGIDNNELYNYDRHKMQSVQEAWLKDNNAQFKPRK